MKYYGDEELTDDRPAGADNFDALLTREAAEAREEKRSGVRPLGVAASTRPPRGGSAVGAACFWLCEPRPLAVCQLLGPQSA
eukprot:14639061-Heterocapsa_arctica.AAC.1